MKTFLYKAFIILVSIVIIDVVVGYVSRYTLAQLPPSNANVPHTVNSLMKEKTDILILGASKAKHGIDPKMLNKHFQMDCYNAGEDGMDMFFYNLILQGMLSRSTPKMVIVDMAPFFKQHPKCSQIFIWIVTNGRQICKTNKYMARESKIKI